MKNTAKVAHKYTAPDYYNLDDLFTDEQKLIRGAVRDWGKRESYAAYQ